MGSIVQRLIADATDTDSVARIDVVAAHRHKDHVPGFADEAWRRVQVREVWLRWTEHPLTRRRAASSICRAGWRWA